MTSRTDFGWVQVPEGQEVIPNIRSLAIDKESETSSSDEEELSSSSSSKEESPSTESEDSNDDDEEEKEDTKDKNSSSLPVTLSPKLKGRRKSWSDQPLSIMW